MNYDNTNQGMMKKNSDKQKDTHPDYKGVINVDGQDYWLSGWIKKSKAGDPYMSLAVKPKEAKQESKPNHSGFDDIDNDLPF